MNLNYLTAIVITHEVLNCNMTVISEVRLYADNWLESFFHGCPDASRHYVTVPASEMI